MIQPMLCVHLLIKRVLKCFDTPKERIIILKHLKTFKFRHLNKF